MQQKRRAIILTATLPVSFPFCSESKEWKVVVKVAGTPLGKEARDNRRLFCVFHYWIKLVDDRAPPHNSAVDVLQENTGTIFYYANTLILALQFD